MSRVFINYIENGKKSPSLEVLVEISSLLQVSLDTLLKDSLPTISENDLNYILKDCSLEKSEILIDSVKGLKDILSKYKIAK